MKVLEIKLNEKLDLEHDIAACIGYFDGFHLGHQALFNKTLQSAKKRNLKSAIITFKVDPWTIIKQAKNISHISTMDDRIQWASDVGFDYMLLLDFNKEMATLDPKDFVEQLILANRVKYLVCGFDFHFGNHGKGNPAFLKSYPKEVLHVKEIDKVTYLDDKISTTRINNAIVSGDVHLAHTLLTRPYTLHGRVIHGNEKGRTIGFPTANVALDDIYVMPKPGVYMGNVIVHGDTYHAIINFGHNPTFNLVNHLSIEAYIIDFNEDIYDQPITIELYEYIRDEKKFDSIDELKAMLSNNVQTCLEYFKE